MENKTFIILGSIAIIILGICYLRNDDLARKMFYLKKNGVPPILPKLMSEKTGVFIMRYGFGFAMVIMGSLILLSRI